MALRRARELPLYGILLLCLLSYRGSCSSYITLVPTAQVPIQARLGSANCGFHCLKTTERSTVPSDRLLHLTSWVIPLHCASGSAEGSESPAPQSLVKKEKKNTHLWLSQILNDFDIFILRRMIWNKLALALWSQCRESILHSEVGNQHDFDGFVVAVTTKNFRRLAYWQPAACDDSRYVGSQQLAVTCWRLFDRHTDCFEVYSCTEDTGATGASNCQTSTNMAELKGNNLPNSFAPDKVIRSVTN